MGEVMFIQVSLDELKQIIRESVNDAIKVNQTTEVERAEDALIKIDVVAKILKVSKVTIHKWKKSGRIPFHRISNRIFFKESEIMESLKKISGSKKPF